MRPIKFRAWDKESKKIVFPNEMWHNINLGLHISTAFDSHLGVMIGLDDEDCILMQFTGLHDKNGKEAYSEDIYKDEVGNVGIIEWDYLLLARLQEIKFEIIGNIYENPELQ